MLQVITLVGKSCTGMGLRAALLEDEGLALMEAATAQDALMRAEAAEAVVLLQAAAFPGALDVIEREAETMAHPPGILVVLPDNAPLGEMVRMIRPGGGCVLDSSCADLLRIGLRTVKAGGLFIDPSICGDVLVAASLSKVTEGLDRLDPAGRLPKRLRRVALLAAMGFSDQEIGGFLCKDHETVGTYLHEAYQALEVTGRKDLSRRFFGRPPCGGRVHKCPNGMRGSATQVGQIAPCPFFAYCIPVL